MIKLVKGEDIRYWYNERNHSLTVVDGGLYFSSMKYFHMQPYFSLYTNNPNIELLVVTRYDYDGIERLLGRALVWTTEDGTKVMDHIYADDDVTWEMIVFAAKNDFKWVQFDNVRRKVRLDKYKFTQYPYLDTFTYMMKDEKGWYLTNKLYISDFPVIELSSHKGHCFYRPLPTALKEMIHATT